MGNHYHLLLETPGPNLVAGMKWLQGTCTQRYNSRHKFFGHLLQGRYKAVIVDGRREESGLYRGEGVGTGEQSQAEGVGCAVAGIGIAAARLLAEGLAVVGLSAADLRRMARSAPEKQVLAWWLLERTTVSLAWLSKRLAMGYETRISQAVAEVESSREPEVLTLKKKLMKCVV